MLQNEFVNGVFDNFLISLCEIFVDLCIEFSVANIYLMSKTKDQTYLNPWLDTSIFRAIRTNTWKSVESTYTLGTMKLEKGKNRD